MQITRFKRGEYIDMVRDLDARKREAIFEPQLPLERLSKYVDQSVTARSKEAIPECLTCGVCCAYLLIVNVRRADTPPLKEYWDVIADGDANDVVIERVLPRNLDDGRCKHLGGELGKAIACDIYPNRPDVCRAFEAGSDRCHEYRRIYGIEPKLDASELEIELAKLPPPAGGIITFVVIEADSVSYSVSFAADGTAETVRDYLMRVSAFLDEDGETAHELHRYRASEETWFESDFQGMTLDEAKSVIASNTRG